MTLLRLRFSKNGKVRFTSHRDLARIWERSLRQARVPMEYSQGYSPRAKISFGLALPTGSESDAEYIDIHVDDRRDLPCPVDDIPGVLTAVMPPGIELTGLAELERGTPSLQQAVTSCVWDLTVTQTIEQANEWIRRVLDSPEIVVTRERKGKAVTDDLRPSIISLEVTEAPDGQPGPIAHNRTVLRAELATKPRSLRPTELLDALEPVLEPVMVRRTEQWIELDGARFEPLEVGAATAPRTKACAS
jgi:radical SAM-linked protein